MLVSVTRANTEFSDTIAVIRQPARDVSQQARKAAEGATIRVGWIIRISFRSVARELP